MNYKKIILFTLVLVSNKLFAEPQYIIHPNIGLKECRIGDDVECLDKITKGSNLGVAWIADNRSLEANIISGKINYIIFYFRGGRTYIDVRTKFSGKTDVGINRDSNPDDVIKAYGNPDDIYDGGAHFDSSYEYNEKLGMMFTFRNDKLVDIRVGRNAISRKKNLVSKNSVEILKGKLVNGFWLEGYGLLNRQSDYKENLSTLDNTVDLFIPCKFKLALQELSKDVEIPSILSNKSRWSISEDKKIIINLDGRLSNGEVLNRKIEGWIKFDDEYDLHGANTFVVNSGNQETFFGKIASDINDCK